MEKIVFVALSHTLTQEQTDSLQADRIVLLADVNTDLANQCRNIDPTWGIDEVAEVAAKVVAEAAKVHANHFICQGEPALAMYANTMAHGLYYRHDILRPYTKLSKETFSFSFIHLLKPYLMGKDFRKQKGVMTCLQSTTKRELISETHEGNGEVTKRTVFKHVQWRELF